jgi:hypothetical protein
MKTVSICYCQSAVHSNEEMMRYQQEIVSIDSKINRDIEVEWVCWFEMCVIWFELRPKCMRFERLHNSEGMKESLLLLRFKCRSEVRWPIWVGSIVIWFIERFKSWSEVRRPICVGSIVIWLSERSKFSSRINEESVVEEIEVIWFRLRFKRTRFGGSCDENCFNLLLWIDNPLKWRNDEISSRNCVNWLHDKSRNRSWVSLLICFEMCVIWLWLRSKCVRFERQYNSDGTTESLL